MNLEEIKYDDKGLIPVITQDYLTKEVLILSYMNEESLKKTVEENTLYYYSRSRNELWKKGETSGNTQILIKLSYDCDGDALLAVVRQKGPACHTGANSCFFNTIIENEEEKRNIIKSLYYLVLDRKEKPVEGSYTNYLFNEGKDKILKKIGEEASEIIIASKNSSKTELVYEVSDFIYHLVVLLVNDDIAIEDISNELEKRFK